MIYILNYNIKIYIIKLLLVLISQFDFLDYKKYCNLMKDFFDKLNILINLY